MAESSVNDYFIKHGILGPNHSSRAAAEMLLIQPSLVEISYDRASQYIDMTWKKIEQAPMPSSLNGQSFELMLACVLIKEGFTPFYMGAEVQFVPNAKFDILLYAEEIGPIVISAKTSLRERYKQADLESQALRAVHRRSKTFLVTLNSQEAAGVQEKIRKGEVTNLESVVVANGPGFDDLIEELRRYHFIEAPTFKTVESGREITQVLDFLIADD